MREVFSRSIAYRSVESLSPAASGWVQAGFLSIAYRLAHLYAPRFCVIFIVGIIFYFA
jgi:hypothetical protein